MCDDNPDYTFFFSGARRTCATVAYLIETYSWTSCSTGFAGFGASPELIAGVEQNCAATCDTVKCPRCTDDPDFVDYWGYKCADNVGLDCGTFVEVFEYTPMQQLDVQVSCPETCIDVVPVCP